MLSDTKARATKPRSRTTFAATRSEPRGRAGVAGVIELVKGMLSRYPAGIPCTHHARPHGLDASRVCFCAYSFPPDMDAESTDEMNGIISAYNRRCGLDMPLLRPPADV